jgi:ABC-type branched-subunit amino acid transport system ATPase component
LGAEAFGVRANRTKVLVFALAAGIAGLGGVLLGLFSFTSSNTTAPPVIGLYWLAIAVVFGIRRPGGALIAGLAFAGGTALFAWLASILPGGTVHALVTSAYFVPILSGLGAIGLAQEPDGILALVGTRKLERKRKKEREVRIASAEAKAHGGAVPTHELAHTVDAADAIRVGSPLAGAAFMMERIVAGYGDVEVLHGVEIALEPGKVVALLGANGAGKSTLCSVAAGLVAPTFGTVTMEGVDITAVPTFQRARDGMLLVPEARGIFPGLTVEENLTVLLRSEELRQEAYERFRILADRRKQQAGLLSGGEQQILSIAPALANPPKVLITDEPTLGLAPLASEQVMRAILELRDLGSAVLVVEEHAHHALEVADTLAVMELGTVVWSGPREQADMDALSALYLGGSDGH